MWVICAILLFLGVDFHCFYLKIIYFYYLCSASLNLKSVDYQDGVVQKELKEDLYNKTDYFKVKYEEILADNDSRAYYGVMWR